MAMIFKSLEEADHFKQCEADRLMQLQTEALALDGVVHTEIWLCGNCPSFVAGFNSEDAQVVSFII
jgi:hypothetical protein